MRIAFLVPDNRDEFRRYSDPEPYFGPAPAALLSGLEALPECEIHIVCCIHRPLRSPPKLGANIYYHSLLVPQWGWMRGGYAGCIRAIRRKLREIKPDLVHGQGTEKYCAMGAAFSGFPNIVTIHGNMRRVALVNGARPFSVMWLAARFEAWTLPRTDGVICLSSHTEKQVQALAKRTWVLPNAVDKSFFEISRNPVTPKQVICVAHIWRTKNQLELIRALDPLAKGKDFKMIFLGTSVKGDPYSEEFFRLLQDRPWCSYQGFADRTEVQAALSRASLLVLPSLEENCPMAILEAMAAGVPVAAASVGGVPDLITSGTDGILFDTRRPATILNAVADLLTDDAKATRFAIAARQKALNLFHPDHAAKNHLTIYRQLLNLGEPAQSRSAGPC